MKTILLISYSPFYLKACVYLKGFPYCSMTVHHKQDGIVLLLP